MGKSSIVLLMAFIQPEMRILSGEAKKGSIEMWIRINSKKAAKNIVRVLSPAPYSPFPIPFDQLIKLIHEKEGTIEFKIKEVGNLFDRGLERVWVFDLPIGSSRLLLIREEFFNLVLYHFSPEIGFRVAKLDVSKFVHSSGLHIFVTWSQKESHLYVGDIEKKVGLLSARAEIKSSSALSGKDGSFLLVGDEGVDVKMLYFKKGERLVIEPNAIDVFNFSIERLNTLIGGCGQGDFLFESTCVQAGLVMLISAFEAYCSKRFIEMESKGWTLGFDPLCKAIFPKKHVEDRKLEIEEKSRMKKKLISEVLIEDRYIKSFQDFDLCKEVFNKGYGVKFGDIPNMDPQIIEKVRKLMRFRHRIVHSGRDVTILNYDEIPDKSPIFSNKQLLEDVKNIFVEFIKKLHAATSN